MSNYVQLDVWFQEDKLSALSSVLVKQGTTVEKRMQGVLLDTHDLRRAADVPLHRQAGLGRSVQSGADLQGASLAGERESQLKFIPAEVVRKNISSPPGAMSIS